MDKRKVLTLIFICFLVTSSLCKEEPNHLVAEASSEVIGFKNPSARHADVPLRSQQHKFTVQTSKTTDSLSSDVERIGSMDGRDLPALKNAQKSIKWTTDDKIRKVATMRKLEFAMRPSARRHKVSKSSHGTRMPSSARESFLKDSKDEETFKFHTAPPSSFTGLSYKTKFTTPIKLTILPTEETVIPSSDAAGAESELLSKKGNTAEQGDQKSSQSDDKEDSSSPHGEPKVTGHEGSTRQAGTSAMPQNKMAVSPGVKPSSGLRWKAAYDHVKLDDSKKGKHFKNKKSKSSEDEEPVPSSSPMATFAGILAGILMAMFTFTGVPRLWRICKKRWRRRFNGKKRLNFPSSGYFSEELSEEEIIFDRTTTTRNKRASPVSTPMTPPEGSQAVFSSQSPDHRTQEQKVWTLTSTPKSTPLMAVPTLDDSPRSGVWMVNEIPETKSLDYLFTTSSLSDLSTETPRSVSLTSVSSILLASEAEADDSDLAIKTHLSVPAFDLTDYTVDIPIPFTTQPRLGPSTSSEQTTLVSSLSSHPSKPSLSSLPTAFGESTPGVFMASDGTSSSTEACKTPVAACNEVLITIDDCDEEIHNSRDKSESDGLSVVKDADKDTSKEELQALDLADNTVHISLPFTTQPRLGPSTSPEQTTLVSSLAPHPSKPSLSSLPAASDEATPSVFMASDGTSSSTESCKTTLVSSLSSHPSKPSLSSLPTASGGSTPGVFTARDGTSSSIASGKIPVAARNDVVITMDDDDEETHNSRDKSESEGLSVVKDADKEASKEELPALDLTDNTVHISLPFKTQPRLGPSTSSKQTTLVSSLAPHPSKPSLSSLLSASDESTPSVFMASDDTSSSTESCKTTLVSSLSSHPSKPSLSSRPTASGESTPGVNMASNGTSSSTESGKTPVAARNDVVITTDDDDEEIHNSDKESSKEELPALDLTDNTVHISLPFTTQPRLGPSTSSEETTLVSSLTLHPSKPSLSSLPTASDKSTPSVFMASDGTSSSTESCKTTLVSSLSSHPPKPSLSSLPTASGESTSGVFMASDGTSSSTESCKTPVAARNDVVITMDHNDEEIHNSRDKSESKVMSVVKDADKESSKKEVVIKMGLDDDEESSVISESESDSSFGKMIYTSQESEMKNVTTGDAIIDVMGRDNDDGETSAINEKSNLDETPPMTLPTIPTIPSPTASTELPQDETPQLTLPTIPPPRASTELPKGEALTGGRKALENRRFIKHLIFEQDSTGFKSDLNAASSRILGEKRNLVDKNKVKRLVIKHQTLETKHSLIESILRAKSMIMNEHVDRERDKRSSQCRHLIQRRLRYPDQRKQTLAQEIAFAKDIVLLRHAHPRDAAGPKAKREVRREDESMTSLNKGASTSNSAKIRVMNHKDYKAWKELQKDIKVKKAQGIKPRDVLQSLQVVRDVYNLPRIPVDSEGGCLCYYCEKHIKRAQRKKIFKLPKKLFSFKSKSSTKESHPDSQSSSFTSSVAAGPSTSSAAHFNSGVSNSRKLFSFKSKSSTKESHSDSQSSSFTSSVAAGPSTSSAAHFNSGVSNSRFACYMPLRLDV